MLTKDAKAGVIGTHRRHESDTGSPQVQVAILTERINALTEHLKITRRTTTRGAVCCRWSGAAGDC